MQTKFLAKDCRISDGEQAYILKRLSEIENLFHEASIFDIEVGMDKRGFFRVEVNVREPHELIRAEEVSKSVEGSIDMVIDKLRVQIVREKDRKRDLEERGARSIKKRMVVDDSARF
jgi:ribosomal subunit interface protein